MTGGQDLNELNLSLLAPCIENMLPEKYRHMQLHVITEKPPLLEPEDCEKSKLNDEVKICKE